VIAVDESSSLAEHDNGNAMATYSLVAVIVVVGLIALFVWQPWSLTSRTDVTTAIAQPGAAAPVQRTTRNASTLSANGKEH